MVGLPRRCRLKVLLVDDCIAERDLYQCVLEPEFYILTAARGLEGAELAAAYRPDAIVLDLLMPGIDGLETCARIKRDTVTAEIPVLLLTGVDMHDLSQRAKAVWAWSVLHKPCPVETLRTAILAATGKEGPYQISHMASRLGDVRCGR
jgi:CheY-like chemotaxis protein